MRTQKEKTGKFRLLSLISILFLSFAARAEWKSKGIFERDFSSSIDYSQNRKTPLVKLSQTVRDTTGTPKVDLTLNVITGISPGKIETSEIFQDADEGLRL